MTDVQRAQIVLTHQRHSLIIKRSLAANPVLLAKATAAALRAMDERCAELGRPSPILAQWIANLDDTSAKSVTTIG